jgi:hypothetical protein
MVQPPFGDSLTPIDLFSLITENNLVALIQNSELEEYLMPAGTLHPQLELLQAHFNISSQHYLHVWRTLVSLRLELIHNLMPVLAGITIRCETSTAIGFIFNHWEQNNGTLDTYL